MSTHIDATAAEARELLHMVSDGWTPDAALTHIRNRARTRNMAPSDAKAANNDTDTAPEKNDHTSQINALRVVTVEIPMAPEKDLIPNQHRKQAHWSTQSRARKFFRNEAAWQASLTLPHNWQPITGPVTLDIFVHWPKRRRPDLDAVVSSCKSAIDGLADAGVVADDKQIKKLTATHDYGAKVPGLTRLTIREMAA